MRTYHAIDVAKRFLELARGDTAAIQDISNMKLQKLCFFAQLVSVCQDISQPLIDNNFHAWDYGPVEPILYRRIRGLGHPFFSIDDEAVANAFSEAEPIDDTDAQNIIQQVWDKFKTWTAVELSELTHRKNSPWSIVYSAKRYDIIPNVVMAKYKFGDPA